MVNASKLLILYLFLITEPAAAGVIEQKSIGACSYKVTKNPDKSLRIELGGVERLTVLGRVKYRSENTYNRETFTLKFSNNELPFSNEKTTKHTWPTQSIIYWYENGGQKLIWESRPNNRMEILGTRISLKIDRDGFNLGSFVVTKHLNVGTNHLGPHNKLSGITCKFD